ncbi:hypothetical protein N658DRAFT_233850 [Parathielavia hyrcaniae]|uniref:Uncharacterized protein n=1 Tax=Parathielavia hyrcaniae TaxID=113614 RepID=A0AAN6T4F8_9PEZI|nr:hypothetical protein N658DRAFT_233850 [Parathielavia hyrcaniae]
MHNAQRTTHLHHSSRRRTCIPVNHGEIDQRKDLCRIGYSASIPAAVAVCPVQVPAHLDPVNGICTRGEDSVIVNPAGLSSITDTPRSSCAELQTLQIRFLVHFFISSAEHLPVVLGIPDRKDHSAHCCFGCRAKKASTRETPATRSASFQDGFPETARSEALRPRPSLPPRAAAGGYTYRGRCRLARFGRLRWRHDDRFHCFVSSRFGAILRPPFFD